MLSHKGMPKKFLRIYELEKKLGFLQLPKILPGSIKNPGWLKNTSLQVSAACGRITTG